MVFLICFVAFLLAILVVIGVVFIGTVIFPISIYKHGWRYAVNLYGVLAIVALFVIAIEIGNLTGFSWKRLAYVPQAEIIDAAVSYSYPTKYASWKEMKVDYSKFKPEIRYWGSWDWEIDNGLLGKLLGMDGGYQVRMPSQIVFVTVNGVVTGARSISDCLQGTPCPDFPPNNPTQAIVGSINEKIIDPKNFTVKWDTSESGETHILGNCFSAMRSGPQNQALTLILRDKEKRNIFLEYGYFLANIEGSVEHISEISKEDFMKYQSCKLDLPVVN